MDEVEVPEENLLGREGEGFKIAMFALDQGRLSVSAGATGPDPGVPGRERGRTRRDRKTFGVPIGQHQLVKEMIAQMESDYQAARLLWMRSAWLKNEGRRSTRETGLAKWFATVASERAAGDAVQIHGANGYSDEYPVGRFYRNCKGAVIYEGTREIHKIMQADYALGIPGGQADAVPVAGLPGGGAGVTATPETTHRIATDEELAYAFLDVVEQAAIACAHTMGQRRSPSFRPGRGRGDARPSRSRSHRRPGGDWRRGARQGSRCCTSASASGSGANGEEGLPGNRHRRRSSGRHEPVRHRGPAGNRRAGGIRDGVGCCTRRTSTCRSWWSARSRRTR